MELLHYPKYKKYDAHWLGDIPSHWGYLPNRALFLEVKMQGYIDEPLLSVTITRGIIRQADLLASSSKKDSSNLDKSKYKLVCVNDFAYNKMRAWQGAIGLSQYQGIVSPAYIVFRSRYNNNLKYFHYLFRTLNFQKEAERLSYGITSDMWSLRFEHFKLIYSCIPPLEEQNKIVSFIEWKNFQINKFIRNKQRLIDLFYEQKQIMINQAVTYGLLNIKLSKVNDERVAVIPKNWKVKRLKYLVQDINAQTDKKLPNEIYIALEHVESWSGRILPPNGEVIFESKVKRFNPDDVLFGKLRPYLAKVTRPQVPGVCVGEFLVLRNKTQEVLSEFIELKLRSKQIINNVNGSTFGAKMPRADWTFIGNIRFTYPSITDQEKIIAFVKEQSIELDKAICRAKCEIDLIREYQARLISDVATGKVDIRNIIVQKIPEEDVNEINGDIDEQVNEFEVEEYIDETDRHQ